MKNENYYRKLFKKEHDSLIGKGDNIQNVMTEDCFVRVIKKLTLTDDSQKRELLEGFVDWFNINDKTQAILSERIEEYLKTL
jgi:hypothetical protein